MAAGGMAIAYNMFVLGTLTSLLLFFVLALDHIPGWKQVMKKQDDPVDE